MSKPIISVIVPVYNAEKYLDQCINSIIHQTYSNIEVLLIENGSQDNSGAICDKYMKSDRRVHVYHYEKLGLSKARNIGIKLAKGEIIAFVDSDDWINDNMLYLLLEAMLSYDVDMAICTHDKFGDILYTPKCDKNITCLTQQQYLDIFTINDEKNSPAVWQRLYKRKNIIDIEFAENEVYEDIVWSIRAILKSKRMVYVDDALYHYRIRPGSITDISNVKKRIVNEDIIKYQIKAYMTAEDILRDVYDERYTANIRMIYLPIIMNSYCSIKFYHIERLYCYRNWLKFVWNSNRRWMHDHMNGFKGRNRIVLTLGAMPTSIYKSIWYMRQFIENISSRR